LATLVGNRLDTNEATQPLPGPAAAWRSE
jgi:hypothetical protein